MLWLSLALAGCPFILLEWEAVSLLQIAEWLEATAIAGVAISAVRCDRSRSSPLKPARTSRPGAASR